MRTVISTVVDLQTRKDIFENHKKFLMMPAAEFIVDPLEGDVLKISCGGVYGDVYRVVTLVEKLTNERTGEENFALSLRPLGKAEKEGMRA